MSDESTPEELVLDQAERGGAAWMAFCEEQLSNDDGCKRFHVFVRKWIKKGGDIDQLTADLAEIPGLD